MASFFAARPKLCLRWHDLRLLIYADASTQLTTTIKLVVQALNCQERAASLGEEHESVDLPMAFRQDADLLDGAVLLDEGGEPSDGSPSEVDVSNVDLVLLIISW